MGEAKIALAPFVENAQDNSKPYRAQVYVGPPEGDTPRLDLQGGSQSGLDKCICIRGPARYLGSPFARRVSILSLLPQIKKKAK